MVATVTINYLAVLVAAIVAFVLGSLWYGVLFGKTWRKLMGFSDKDMQKAKQKGMGKSYFLMFLGLLVTSYVLAHFVGYLGATTVTQGLELACWLWIGFFVPTMLGMVLWDGKPWALYFINVLHYLIVLAAMSSILAIWQ